MIEFDVIQSGGFFGFIGPESMRGSVGPVGDDQHVEIAADEGDTLGSVLYKAARLFGIDADTRMFPGATLESGLYWVSFFKPQHLDPDSEDHPVVQHEVIGVDEDEIAHWASFRDMTCGDLIRAGEAGLIDGDVRRPYLIPWVPQGGGALPEWHVILNVLTALRDIANSPGPLLNTYAIYEIVHKLARRAWPAKKAIEHRHQQWADRGAGLREAFALVSAKPWQSKELARLLCCSQKEVEALLWGWGFSYDQHEGLWKREEGTEAGVLRYIVDLADHDHALTTGDANQRLRELFEDLNDGVS
jgi:hypothetical protein